MASDGQEFNTSSDNLLPDSSNDQLWRTQELRQKARGQIEEALQQSKNPTNKSPVEMETHVFNKAQTKEEYLQFIARLIIHFREFNKNAQKQQAQSGSAMLDQMQPNVGTMGNLSSSQSTGSAQDPMSALHTLAQRGGGVSGPITSMAAAMPQQVMVGVQGVQPQSGMSMQGQSLQNMVIHGQQQIAVQAQSQPGAMNTMQPQQQQHQFISGMSQPQMDHVMTSLSNQQPNMSTLQGHQLQGQVSHGTMPMQGPQSVVPMQSQPQPNIYPTPRAVMSTMNPQQQKQFQEMRNHLLTRVRGQVQGVAMMPPGQVMHMQRVQVPAQRGPPPEQYQLSPQQMIQQQMAPPGSAPNVAQGFSSTISPAGLTSHSPASGPQSLQPPSMGSQMIPSPSPNMGPTPSPGPGTALSPASGIGRPVSSPSAGMLNTPLSGAQSASPAPPSAEEQAYWDKLQQLSKYIEPLQELIAQSEKGDGKEGKRDQSKLKSLLGLLTNPKRRTQLHVLIQCEQVLEKMDLLRDQSQSQQPHQQPSQQQLLLQQQQQQQQQHQHQTTQFPVLMIKQDRLQEQNMFQPLLDALHTHLNKPLLNHTLQRTFGPSLAALCGPPIRAPSPPIKRQKTSSDEEEENDEIPDVLQGEVAQLDERFRVNLDNLHHAQSNTVHLVCKLQSSQLPAVPPIGIVVPGNYPDSSPQCEIRSQDYDCTPFLKAVEKSLQKQLSKMPHKYSITAILNAWEMSIRQACNAARLQLS